MNIPPTVGRVVLYRRAATSTTLAALVAQVNEDGTLNLAVFNETGVATNAVDVPLVQDGEAAPEAGHHCHWMAYQIGQAAKTEQLQAAVVTQAPTAVPDVPELTTVVETAPAQAAPAAQ